MAGADQYVEIFARVESRIALNFVLEAQLGRHQVAQGGGGEPYHAAD
jgi:hypothetical protein